MLPECKSSIRDKKEGQMTKTTVDHLNAKEPERLNQRGKKNWCNQISLVWNCYCWSDCKYECRHSNEGQADCIYITYNNDRFITNMQNTLQLSYCIKVYASMHVCNKLAVNWKNLHASVKELYFVEVNLHVEKCCRDLATSIAKTKHCWMNCHSDSY